MRLHGEVVRDAGTVAICLLLRRAQCADRGAVAIRAVRMPVSGCREGSVVLEEGSDGLRQDGREAWSGSGDFERR
jgi:hypothetical protein